MKIQLFVFLTLVLLTGCINDQTAQKQEKPEAAKPASTPPTGAANANSSSVTANSAAAPEKDTVSRDQNKAACLDLKRDDMALDEKQTFGIDFPPFGKSCFVVFHDPEFDNPPLNSQYFVYKDGKEAFAFPEQFNGSNIGCWLEAVSFEDMNGDSLNDIAIAAKCSAKSKPYPENMVYINTGKDFKTNVQANMEMMDFTKMSQIKQYVKEHQSLFAK